MSLMTSDDERCWAAVRDRDARYDGRFVCGVMTTGIACRPSCPGRPKRENVRFFASLAAALEAGLRACRRCRPFDAPASPAWEARDDVVGRALRLVADGAVERAGLAGVARWLGVAEGELEERMVAATGAGVAAHARARGAHLARVLLEKTNMSRRDVALATGLGDARALDAALQGAFAQSGVELRGRRRTACPRAQVDGALVLRLAFRAPLDGAALVAFLGHRVVAGVEEVVGGAYRRSLGLAHGDGVVELEPQADHVVARLWLDDARDLGQAIARARALLRLDADPAATRDALGADAVLGPLVRAAPGLRVPGHVDGDELAIRAVLGQQVSVAGAATLASRLVADCGTPLARPVGGATHRFPTAAALAASDPARLAMPHSRRRAVLGLAAALAAGDVALDPGADRAETRRRLLALPGIGPWTADYVALRALRDPDAFLPDDLGVRRALVALGADGRPGPVRRLAEAWRPHRAAAVGYLWASLAA
jgi:AraC family transcriptional regulator of adaptative response / DNA-3-methyladenine glycosylase II